jgi:hypothetical protein
MGNCIGAEPKLVEAVPTPERETKAAVEPKSDAHASWQEPCTSQKPKRGEELLSTSNLDDEQVLGAGGNGEDIDREANLLENDIMQMVELGRLKRGPSIAPRTPSKQHFKMPSGDLSMRLASMDIEGKESGDFQPLLMTMCKVRDKPACTLNLCSQLSHFLTETLSNTCILVQLWKAQSASIALVQGASISIFSYPEASVPETV